VGELSIVKGTTSKLIDVFIQDSSSTTGAGLTGLAFGSAGLTAYYYREGAAASVAITLATMTRGTWATGGFIVVDATNMPGLYQIGVPDAAFATGANSVVVMLKGAANMAPVVLEIELTVFDNQSASADPWATALPGAYGTGTAGKIVGTNLDAQVSTRSTLGGTAQTGDCFARLGAPAGVSTAADIAAVKAVLPAGTTAVGTSGGLPTCDANNSVKIQSPLKKNTAALNFCFPMYDNNGNPKTGLTVTAQRRIDNGAFAACTNAPTEVANGWYTIDLTAADLNGNSVALRFSCSGNRDTNIAAFPNS